jgi:hypothetical protein
MALVGDGSATHLIGTDGVAIGLGYHSLRCDLSGCFCFHL